MGSAEPEYHSHNDRQGGQGHRQAFTTAAFSRAWADASMTAAEVGAMFGITGWCANWRAKSMGLQKKIKGRRPTCSDVEFVALWSSKLSTEGMAELLKRHVSSIHRRAERMGLPPRKSGFDPDRMTLAAYRETILAKAMAETARIEQAQIKLAEMWDHPSYHPTGKRTAA